MGHPVISIVLWLFKSKSVPSPPYRMYAGSRLVATWDFISIELYKLSASAIINAGVVGLLPLIPFTQGASAEVVELAMRRVRDGAPEEQAAQLAVLLGVFITRFHSEDLALNLVRRYFMSTEILQEFPLFRSIMADAEAKGEVKGMREAIARADGALWFAEPGGDRGHQQR